MAAASRRELGTTEPVRWGFTSHSCRNSVVSLKVASKRLGMMSKIDYRNSFQLAG
jgi:hypothetical protein